MNKNHHIRVNQGEFTVPNQASYSSQKEINNAEEVKVVGSIKEFPEGAFVAQSGIATDGQTVYVCPRAMRVYLESQSATTKKIDPILILIGLLALYVAAKVLL
jgi:hypothetical protein